VCFVSLATFGLVEEDVVYDGVEHLLEVASPESLLGLIRFLSYYDR